jgi:hypothetical protein
MVGLLPPELVQAEREAELAKLNALAAKRVRWGAAKGLPDYAELLLGSLEGDRPPDRKRALF